jgi:hypothetical protein
MHERAACMSFGELHALAHGRAWSADESARFAALSQAEKNAAVRTMAAKAGNVDVEDRVGADGVVYTAFWVRGTA